VPVGIGCTAISDGSHTSVVRIIVVPKDDGEAATGLAVGEPIGTNARFLKSRYDLIEHVRDSSLEVGRRLVLEGDHLCVLLSGEIEGLMPAIGDASS
jgi:hypothetical protein